MAERNPERLDRDQQILNRLARIEHKVDSIDQTNAFALRAEADKHSESVKRIFRNSQRRAQVYLAANGQRTVNEIADRLQMRAQNVSRELQALHDEGMLEIVDTDGTARIWAKKSLDRTLRISKFLCSEYDLALDGTVTKAK